MKRRLYNIALNSLRSINKYTVVLPVCSTQPTINDQAFCI